MKQSLLTVFLLLKLEVYITMSLQNFIPTVWAGTLLKNINVNHVYGNIVNRNYEGEISGYGDTVKINSIGRVTVGDYTKDTDINSPESLTSAQTTLLIDQSKYFNFEIDDVDKAQTNPKVMNEAMGEAAYALADVTDKFIANLYTGATNAIGTDAAPVVPTKADAYDYLVDLSIKLGEANIPRQGRFVVVPEWFYGMLQKDDRFIHATQSGDSVIATGLIGKAAGFDVYTSNNVPNVAGAKYKIIAGHPMAITFAEQIVSVEAFRPEKRFGDAVKGLHVYGGKLVRPSALAILTVNKA